MVKKARFESLLRKRKVIYLDTNIFIYHLEDKSPYSELTHIIFEMLESGKIRAHTSVLTIAEINVGPYKNGRADLSFSHIALLEQMKHLSIHPIDTSIADLAAQYRARFSFKTPDALHLATSTYSQSKLFAGNDKGLQKYKEIEHLLLDDFC